MKSRTTGIMKVMIGIAAFLLSIGAGNLCAENVIKIGIIVPLTGPAGQ